MGYDIDAYFREEYGSINRVPGWENSYPERYEKADVIATLERAARSRSAAELFNALHAEEFDGVVSGNAGSRFFSRPQIINGIQYIGSKVVEEPFLDRELVFLATILERMNRSDSPENAVVWIWFC